MDVMTDKEVGELWKAVHESKYYAYQQCAALIRKLVEERHAHNCESAEGRRQRSLAWTLAEFGIDPATWNE